MSLLDGLPTSKEQIIGGFELAAPLLKGLFESKNLPPRARSAIEEMKAGVPMATLLNLTSRELDALFNQACRTLQFGDIETARGSALMLYQLKPLDARYLYLLAATFQAEADYVTAGKLYVSFLVLDATNPEGWLRLGECFMGNKEPDMARESFRVAGKFAAKGTAPDQHRAYAQQMMAMADSQLQSAAH